MKLENFFHKIYKKLKNLNIKKIILIRNQHGITDNHFMYGWLRLFIIT